jgi:LmbE family N-acetylglucosaminyl deacetylase
VVVAPHPDDEMGCGGAVLLHRRAGDDVHIACVTDGRGSRAGGLGPDEMARQRHSEMVAAARALGLGEGRARWLGFREWEWEGGAVEAALRDLLRDTTPDVVYAPSCIDFHPEHLRVAACLARALASHEWRDVIVRVYQIQVPLTPLLVNLVAPIEPVTDQLVAAMRCYRTQFGSIERCLRMKRYAAAFYGMRGYVEEFWDVSPAAYTSVHAGVEQAQPFRGVRWWPFSDPLCYLRGLSARRRLRNLACAPRPSRVGV